MTAVRRPVRVTIDGEAYNPPGADNVLIVVRQDGGKVVLATNSPGVTVEDVTPERVWTDGDVVLGIGGRGGIVYTRGGGAWHGIGATGNAYSGLEDAEITAAAGLSGAVEARVLRYQAGESE